MPKNTSEAIVELKTRALSRAEAQRVKEAILSANMELVLNALVKKAVTGDLRAIQQVLDRYFGRPIERRESISIDTRILGQLTDEQLVILLDTIKGIRGDDGVGPTIDGEFESRELEPEDVERVEVTTPSRASA